MRLSCRYVSAINRGSRFEVRDSRFVPLLDEGIKETKAIRAIKAINETKVINETIAIKVIKETNGTKAIDEIVLSL